MVTKSISRRDLLGKSSVLMVLKLMTAALAFIFHLLLARQLSVESFGLFSLAFSCLVFTTAFTKQGIEPAITRYFSQCNISKIQSLYFYVLVFVLVNCVIVAFIVLFFSEFISVTLLSTKELIELLPLIIGLTSLQTWLAVNCNALKGRQFPISSMLFTGLITYFVACIFIYISPVTTALDALILLFYAVVIATLISVFLTKKKLKLAWGVEYSIENSGVLKLYKTSRVLFVSSLASLLIQQLSLLMLARYTSLIDVGLYSIALKVSLLLSYPLVVLNTITAPKYAQMYAKGDFKGFKLLAGYTTKGLIFIATPLCIFVGVFSTEIVSIFGQQYLLSAQILIILVIGQWFNLSTGPVVSMLVMSGYEKVHRLNSMVIAGITVIAMVVFVPMYGVIAAAWVTTITMALLNIVSLFYVNRYVYAKA